MSLYHGFELLQLHGLKSLYTYLEGLSSGDKGYGRTRTELNKNGDFRDLMDNLHSKFAGAKRYVFYVLHLSRFRQAIFVP